MMMNLWILAITIVLIIVVPIICWRALFKQDRDDDEKTIFDDAALQLSGSGILSLPMEDIQQYNAARHALFEMIKKLNDLPSELEVPNFNQPPGQSWLRRLPPPLAQQMKGRLMKRTLAILPKLPLIPRELQAKRNMVQRGLLSEKQWINVLKARDMINHEMEFLRFEAECLNPTWGFEGKIFKEAMKIHQHMMATKRMPGTEGSAIGSASGSASGPASGSAVGSAGIAGSSATGGTSTGIPTDLENSLLMMQLPSTLQAVSEAQAKAQQELLASSQASDAGKTVEGDGGKINVTENSANNKSAANHASANHVTANHVTASNISGNDVAAINVTDDEEENTVDEVSSPSVKEQPQKPVADNVMMPQKTNVDTAKQKKNLEQLIAEEDSIRAKQKKAGLRQKGRRKSTSSGNGK